MAEALFFQKIINSLEICYVTWTQNLLGSLLTRIETQRPGIFSDVVWITALKFNCKHVGPFPRFLKARK